MIEIRISDEAKSCADRIMANFISSGASASTAFITAQAIEELLNQRDAELEELREQIRLLKTDQGPTIKAALDAVASQAGEKAAKDAFDFKWKEVYGDQL